MTDDLKISKRPFLIKRVVFIVITICFITLNMIYSSSGAPRLMFQYGWPLPFYEWSYEHELTPDLPANCHFISPSVFVDFLILCTLIALCAFSHKFSAKRIQISLFTIVASTIITGSFIGLNLNPTGTISDSGRFMVMNYSIGWPFVGFECMSLRPYKSTSTNVFTEMVKFSDNDPRFHTDGICYNIAIFLASLLALPLILRIVRQLWKVHSSPSPSK